MNDGALGETSGVCDYFPPGGFFGSVDSKGF